QSEQPRGDERSGQLVADQLDRWKLTKGQVKHASGLKNSHRDIERWLAPIKPHLQHLTAASSAGTSLEANLEHITITLPTWDGLEQEVAMKRHGRAKQLVVSFGAASIGTRGVAPRKPPQAPCSSQAATQPAASEPGPSTPSPDKRSKRTKAEQAAELKSKAVKSKPAPQPGRWLDRDCNAALNMQRNGESRWRPLELCYWPEQGKLPAKGREYPGLGYMQLRDKPPKAQQQHCRCGGTLSSFAHLPRVVRATTRSLPGYTARYSSAV
ncbi:hypothetical protein QJQ45_021036, partial [Haematococcus lacustris]